MALLGLLRCQRPDSSSCTSTAAANSRRCGSTVGLARLMRKLRKQCKLLPRTAERRPTASAFHCQYDPLSYSLNFDGDGESTHFYYTFSWRFVHASDPASSAGRLAAAQTMA